MLFDYFPSDLKVIEDYSRELNRSRNDWNLQFGYHTISLNWKLALNKVYLFKGHVERRRLEPDQFSSENNNSACSDEIVGGEHMVCLTCSDAIHGLLPDKIACLATEPPGVKFGP